FNNLLGLMPLLDIQHLFGHYALGNTHFAVLGGTATGNIAVTFALAIVAFFVIQIAGIRSAGVGGWLKHLTAGAPWYIWPIMIPVEIMGTFIKPAALAIRLFANMTAGHVLLAVLLGFTGMFLLNPDGGWNLLVGGPVTIVAVSGAVAIMFLELFVAFLQAFIFMFLTTLFIAQMMHHEHDEHHEGEEYDVDHPMKDDKSVPVSAV
ncbi:MAG: F0F1 ATP synthase subunit A, partial [Phycisphaerales bacterium]|nr:F0F1 ATP synthase subunit A [Phycisphaerales bacterium]